MSTERTDTVVRDLLRRLHQAISEHDVSYAEYEAAKQWLIDLGEAGEWPLFLDVFVESAVERNAFRSRAGSQGTILGPYHLPDAPLLDAPFDLPRRADERGDVVVMSGSVLDADGRPLAGAELDVWQADADGLYSGFAPGLPAGNLRGKVLTDAEGRYQVRTIMPAPYTIPQDGPTGRLTQAAGWSPWRPAHIHLIVSAEGHDSLTTQLFFAATDHLGDDVAGAVKDDLIVTPEPGADGELAFTYDFRLSAVGAVLAEA